MADKHDQIRELLDGKDIDQFNALLRDFHNKRKAADAAAAELKKAHGQNDTARRERENAASAVYDFIESALGVSENG